VPERLFAWLFGIIEEKSVATASPVVETVSRRRVIPADQDTDGKRARTTPEFWEFIEAMTPEMWAGDYLLYILREDPKPSMYGGTNTLEKCPGYIAMPDGTKSPLSSREDIELAIKQKYGGKAFRLILKKGSERISEGKCMNEAPVRTPDAIPGYPSHPLPNASTDASVASQAIDAMKNQQPDAVRLAMDVLRSASDLVMRQANPQNQPAAQTQNSLIEQSVIKSLIDKALAPPPTPQDPFELFLKFKELLQPPATNGVKETLELVTTLKNSGLIGLGAGRSTLLDLGREVIPQVASTVLSGIHEWRLGVEAQVRGLELSRGMNPQPSAPGPAAPAPQIPVAEQPSAAAPPVSEQAAVPSGEPPFDWLAIKIVEILKEPGYTIDEAVDETLSFLYRSHAPVVALLLDPPKLDERLPQGEQGLLMLFQHHAVLKQIPVNPRLAEFIKKFVIAAKEAEAERLAATKPIDVSKSAPPAGTPA
jgi:hypothetical protein